MRTIKYIVVHCTGGDQKQTVGDLRMEFKRKGWKNPGYHYVVTADGVVYQLLDESKVSNGVKGYNSVSVNIAYTGGVAPDNIHKYIDNRSEAQKRSLVVLLKKLRKSYPNAVIQGHRDFPNVAKACPCFNAKTEYKVI